MIEKASEMGALTAVASSPDEPRLTAGGLLRQARETHGVHLEVLAAALKVPVQKLDALERDAIEELPDPVFARALAASVCRALRVDPAPVLAQLPGAPVAAGLADADKTLGSSFRTGGPRSGRGTWLPSRVRLGVVALLLLGAAALFFLPQSVLDTFRASVKTEASPQGDAGGESTGEAPAEPAVEPTAAGAVAKDAAPVPPPPATAVVAAGAALLPVATAPGAMPAGSNPLVFTARADAWITVVDAGGAVLLKRTVAAGETVGLSGNLPLSVVVGRAASVDVQVRGQPLDLKPLTRGGGVARFEVKP